MKKTFTILLATLISSGSIAAPIISGHGYTILEHKVTNFDEKGTIIAAPPTAEKKTLMMGQNSASAHEVTTKINTPTRVYADHGVTIQNLSGYTKTYTYGYWLKVNGHVTKVDDKVQLIHNGVLMLEDQTQITNLIFQNVMDYSQQACTYSSENQTACNYENVRARK